MWVRPSIHSPYGARAGGRKAAILSEFHFTDPIRWVPKRLVIFASVVMNGIERIEYGIQAFTKGYFYAAAAEQVTVFVLVASGTVLPTCVGPRITRSGLAADRRSVED